MLDPPWEFGSVAISKSHRNWSMTLETAFGLTQIWKKKKKQKPAPNPQNP